MGFYPGLTLTNPPISGLDWSLEVAADEVEERRNVETLG